MDEALFALIAANATVSGLVGPRIFWGVAQQGAALPALVLTIVSGADAPHLTGTDGLWRYRVQVDCYGANRPQARTLSRAVVELLNGRAFGNILGAFVESTRENYDSDAADRPHRVSIDFIIMWRG